MNQGTPKPDSQQATLALSCDLSVIHERLDGLRRRTRLAALLRGTAGASWAWLISLAALGSVSLLFTMPVASRLALLALHLVAISVGAWLAVGRTQWRRHALRDWALRYEEHFPHLDKRMVTCVDLASQNGSGQAFRENPMARALLSETAEMARSLRIANAIPRRRLRRSAVLAALPWLAALAWLAVSPLTLRNLFLGLYHYDRPANVRLTLFPSRYHVTELRVRPGDIEIPIGQSARVEADLVGHNLELLGEGPQIELASRAAAPASHLMVAAAPSSITYLFTIPEVRKEVLYEVAVEGLRSPRYKITPYEPPAVASIGSTVTLPAYTRRRPAWVEGGSISALTGSTVLTEVRANHPLRSARLVEASGAALDAEVSSATARFTFPVEGNRDWRLELVDEAVHANLDPPAILLRAEEDTPPEIKVPRPGADWAVHPIGEVTTEAEASDSIGLTELLIEYRLNGGDPTTETLYQAAQDADPPTQYTGRRLFDLEALKLKPGDVISYRWIARDGQPDPSRSQAVSQLYFVTVNPFAQEFREGKPAQAGDVIPGPDQKQIIVATLKLAEQRGSLGADQFREQARQIAQGQDMLRDKMENCVLKGMRKDPNLPNREERIKHAELAVAAMKEATGLLERGEVDKALPPENEALNHQLAAVAGLPEYARQIIGSGKTPFAPNPRMDLLAQKLELAPDRYELDKKNQQGKKREFDEQLVKAMKNVRDLARRQKEFDEKIKKEACKRCKPKKGGEGNMGEGFGRGSGGSQGEPGEQSQQNQQAPQQGQSASRGQPNEQNQQRGQQSQQEGQSPPQNQQSEQNESQSLQNEADQTRRDLEELRKQIDQLQNFDPERKNQLKQALQKAAEELAKIDQALREGDLEKAQNANTRALDQLARMEQALKEQREGETDARLQALAAALDEWIARQTSLKDSTQGLSKLDQAAQTPQREGLASQQGSMGGQVGQAAEMMSPENENEPGRAALAEIEKQLKEAAKSMGEAAQDLSKAYDQNALHNQQQALDQLKSLREATARELARRASDPMRRLAKALETVRSARQGLAPQPGQQAQPSGSQDQAPPSEDQTAPNPSGDGRSDGEVRVKRQPGLHPHPPGTAPAFVLHDIQIKLQGIKDLLESDPPLLEQLGEIERLMGEAPDIAPDQKLDIKLEGDLVNALDELRQMIEDRIAMIEQKQQLERTTDEDLPPALRALAAKYYEKLSTTLETPEPGKAVQR